ncbi:MAG: phosphate/phosphite/phosphonate ABC transporter substrate-binding protein [Thermoanaerobaculia bacterium]
MTVIAATLFWACGRSGSERYTPEFTREGAPAAVPLLFGVHPLHNPQHLFEVYGPVVDHLNRNLHQVRIQLEASRSYEEFEKKLYARHFHFALPNPVQSLESLGHGYRIFGKMGDDGEFRGILIVRKDAGIETVDDLRGKIVSFPAPTALAATMMPLWFLHSKGLDVNRGIERLFSGSQESSIMNVYLGRSAAAATWPVPWKTFAEGNPAIAKELVVRWETPSLVNNGLVVRDDVPRKVADELGALLFSLHKHEEGRMLLSAIPLSRFEPATEATYQPVRDFLKTYREVIR